MTAVEQTEQGLRLRIFLQPKAAKDHIVGLHGDELKISITAPPIKQTPICSNSSASYSRCPKRQLS